VSGVFQNIDPPPPHIGQYEAIAWEEGPLSNQRVCLPPAPKARGTHSPGREGVSGQYFGRRQTLDWPLTIISLRTETTIFWQRRHFGPSFQMGSASVRCLAGIVALLLLLVGTCEGWVSQNFPGLNYLTGSWRQRYLNGDVFVFYVLYSTCRPSDNTVPEDARIDRTQSGCDFGIGCPPL
jgi:hypothetical protein